MEIFAEFLGHMDDPAKRERAREIFAWVLDAFPSLEPQIKWNQPMFTDHGTFIIGFSVAKKHIAVAPEGAAMERFCEEIAQSGYESTRELIRIPWDKGPDFALLSRIIAFNIEDKAECTSFWRKSPGV